MTAWISSTWYGGVPCSGTSPHKYYGPGRAPPSHVGGVRGHPNSGLGEPSVGFPSAGILGGSTSEKGGESSGARGPVWIGGPGPAGNSWGKTAEEGAWVVGSPAGRRLDSRGSPGTGAMSWPVPAYDCAAAGPPPRQWRSSPDWAAPAAGGYLKSPRTSGTESGRAPTCPSW